MDLPLTAAELGARQLYWRSALLRRPLAMVRKRRAVREAVAVPLSQLLDRLEESGAHRDALLMVHSSLDGIMTTGEGEGATRRGGALGMALLDQLRARLGPGGTLVLPTHPLYRDDPGFMHDKRHLSLTYDPRRTPCKVGLLGELFRRSPGVSRSLHPLSSLASMGPETERLLRNNLNSERPLPHGVHSGYFRFCQRGGTVVSINTPLIHAISIAHTAEEVRDEAWPVPGFFYERRFRVRTEAGEEECVVRERHPRWVRNISLGQLRRDLLREGILREGLVGPVRVDRADARAMLEYMCHRNARGPYPYLGLLRRYWGGAELRSVSGERGGQATGGVAER
jgi:aminoglycoside 3-N-acetyltransferase